LRLFIVLGFLLLAGHFQFLIMASLKLFIRLHNSIDIHQNNNYLNINHPHDACSPDLSRRNRCGEGGFVGGQSGLDAAFS